jgi:hypothetical protein
MMDEESANRGMVSFGGAAEFLGEAGRIKCSGVRWLVDLGVTAPMKYCS